MFNLQPEFSIITTILYLLVTFAPFEHLTVCLLAFYTYMFASTVVFVSSKIIFYISNGKIHLFNRKGDIFVYGYIFILALIMVSVLSIFDMLFSSAIYTVISDYGVSSILIAIALFNTSKDIIKEFFDSVKTYDNPDDCFSSLILSLSKKYFIKFIILFTDIVKNLTMSVLLPITLSLNILKFSNNQLQNSVLFTFINHQTNIKIHNHLSKNVNNFWIIKKLNKIFYVDTPKQQK